MSKASRWGRTRAYHRVDLSADCCINHLKACWFPFYQTKFLYMLYPWHSSSFFVPCPSLNPSLFKANFYFHFRRFSPLYVNLFITRECIVYWLQHCLSHLIIQHLEIQLRTSVYIFPIRIWLDVYTNKKGMFGKTSITFFTLLPLQISAPNRAVKLASSWG